MDVILCARGGSSRVKRKNVRNLAGKPLISHSIEFARSLDFVDRIHINSDDDEILEISDQYDCTSYRRPKQLGSGNVFVIDVIREMLLSKKIGELNFIVMFPTVPLRLKKDFERGFELFQKLNCQSQVVSVSAAPYPYEVGLNLEDQQVSPKFPEYYLNSTRHTDYQNLYHANYSFVFSSGKTLLENKTLIETGAYAIETHPMSSIDIDDEFQFTIAEALYEKLFK